MAEVWKRVAVARDEGLPGRDIPGAANRGQAGAGAHHHDAVLEGGREPQAVQLQQPGCRALPVDHSARLRRRRFHPHHCPRATPLCQVHLLR